MTWFDLVKISVIDEVLQHLESTKNSYFRDLRIKYEPTQYGMNEQQDTFYVNTKMDLHQLGKYFYKSDDFEIYSSEVEPDYDFSVYRIPDWFIVRKK